MNKENLTKVQRKEKTEKGTNRLNYFILVGLIILFVVYRSFFKTVTIGGDSRYLLVIVLFPTFLGITILGYFKSDFLRFSITEAKGALQKVFLGLIYLILGFLFAYLSVGLFARIIWDNLNKRTADLYPAEVIYCRITDINSGTSKSSPNIYFLFRGHNECLSIDHATYGKYYNTKPVDLNLQLTVRKGIWNCYILDGWEIIKHR